MALLPPEALTLTGGCFCGSIKYKVEVPALKDRPAVPDVLPTPISETQNVETRLPVIDLDHCESCRRVSGAIIQSWFICPSNWVKWSLRPKTATIASAGETADHDVKYDIRAQDVVLAPTENSSEEARNSCLTHFQASNKATRTFCSQCGTHLTYMSHRQANDPDAAFDITVGSFDNKSLLLVHPDRHGWFDDGVSWIQKLLTKGDGGWLIRHPTGSMSTQIET